MALVIMKYSTRFPMRIKPGGVMGGMSELSLSVPVV